MDQEDCQKKLLLLSQQLGVNLVHRGTSPQDNYQVFQSDLHHIKTLFLEHQISTEYGWLKETIKNEIDIWEDDDLLENVYGVTKLYCQRDWNYN